MDSYKIKEKLKALYRECFFTSERATEYMFSEKLGLWNSFYCLKGDELTGMVFLGEKQLFYRGKILPLPFVTALATSKNFRCQGIATGLLRKAVSAAGKRAPFVMLYPDVADFYEKRGFSTVSYDFQPVLLEKGAADAKSLYSLYEKYVEKFDFYIVRDEKAFSARIRELAFGGSGYNLLYDKDRVVGFTCAEESVALGGEFEYYPGVMARIASLERAFALTDITLPFGIKVIDSLVQENNGTFIVKKGRLMPTQEYRVTVDISELTSLFFGAPFPETKYLPEAVGGGRRLKKYFPRAVRGRILDRY